MTVIVDWTDETMHNCTTEIEDWRVCENIGYYSDYTGVQIIRMTLDKIVKKGIVSINDISYRDD